MFRLQAAPSSNGSRARTSRESLPSRRRPDRTPLITVIVHHLEQARALLEVARDRGIEVELRSAPEAAAYAGVGYLKALSEELGRPVVVDCGTDPGLVMGALRATCKDLAFGGPAATFAKLDDMALASGASLRHEPVPQEVLVLRPDEIEPADLLRRLDAHTQAAAG